MRSSSEDTLSKQVTHSLESYIVGQLQQGDRLPTEREMAQQYGVSRTVVREAVRALTARGLVQAHARSRYIVSTPTQASVSQSITTFLRAGMPELNYRKVMEVRFLLEVQIAGLAAERRTDDDLVKMNDILRATPLAENVEQFVEVDMAFHSALAMATHNELYSLLLASIAEVMRAVRVLAFELNNEESRTERAYHYHSAIYEQVKQGDANGARAAMRQHMIEAEDTIMRVMAARALKPKTR